MLSTEYETVGKQKQLVSTPASVHSYNTLSLKVLSKSTKIVHGHCADSSRCAVHASERRQH